MAKLMSVHYTKAPISCESCGHEIHNIYEVSSNGNTLHIGSECAKSMLGSLSQVIARYERQSAKEWRELESKPENEERGAFVTRRINEKIVARKAWIEWKSLDKMHGWNYNNPWTPEELKSTIATLEQKYNSPCSEWINKTAYTI